MIEQLLEKYTEKKPLTSVEISTQIQAACEYMDKHFEESICLDDLSRIAGLNKYTLLRSFTRQRGTILIWGTTFISTKVLLTDFLPIEILFYRFVLGLLALLIVYPHRFRVKEKKHELTFAAAGFCGVTLYYLLENIALTYTTASNVGVIISVSPFFTAIFAYFILHEEKPKAAFFVGFVLSMLGICLISFNGNKVLQLNPLGDLLAIFAAIVWAGYAVLSRKIGSYGYNTIQATRRVFTYGILFMLPAMIRFEPDVQRFANPVNLLNILFLGLGASALCFVTWNTAVKLLGAVRTSVYIYMVPVITVLISILVLHETLTIMSAAGMLLSLTGLFLSEYKQKERKDIADSVV